MKVIASIILLAALSVGAAEYRIDFNDLSELGAWTIKEENGKAQLYSNDTVSGDKPNVASGKFKMPKAGEYTVWVAAFSFGGGWRKSELRINGKRVGVYGDAKLPAEATKGYGLVWKKAMKKASLDGEFTVEIKALSKVSRFNDIILTDNADFNPTEMSADELEEIDLLVPAK